VAQFLQRSDRGFRVFERNEHGVGVADAVRRLLAARPRRDAF